MIHPDEEGMYADAGCDIEGSEIAGITIAMLFLVGIPVAAVALSVVMVLQFLAS